MNEILNAKNISKKFGNKSVLERISFSLRQNESIGFIGPSGCGKTTLIRIIAGLDGKYNGKIEKGTERIAVVFQQDRLIPWRTLKQNFEFISNDKAKIEEALNISELKEYENLYPSQLSGGMRQRANFARIIFNNPELILLDEPFQSLDLKTKDKIISYFLKLKHKLNFATILVSHDIKEEIMLCDRIYFLSKNPATIIKEVKIKKPYSPKSIFDEFILKKEIEIVKSPYYL